MRRGFDTIKGKLRSNYGSFESRHLRIATSGFGGPRFTIFIDGDDLVKRDGTLEQWIALVMQAIVQKCTQSTHRTIFVAFPLRPEDWEYLRRHLNANLMCVTLSPPLDVALSQRDSRKLTAWEENRIQEMYREGYQSRGFSGLIHDNGSESADETAQHIADYLRVTLSLL